MTRKTASNQPTFPAFFTKTAKNQQKRTTLQEAGAVVDDEMNNDGAGGSVS